MALPYHQTLKEALGRATASGDLSGAASLLRLAARAQAPADARKEILAVVELTVTEMIGCVESLGQDVVQAFEAQDAADAASQKKPNETPADEAKQLDEAPLSEIEKIPAETQPAVETPSVETLAETSEKTPEKTSADEAPPTDEAPSETATTTEPEPPPPDQEPSSPPSSGC